MLEAGTWNWEKVLSEAKKKNPALAAAEKSVRSAELSYKSAFTGYAPTFSGDLGMRDGSSSGGTSSAGISGRLSLFRGFRNASEIRIQKTALAVEEMTYRREFADFKYRLRIAFAQVLKAEKSVSLYDSITQRRKRNYELVKLRYEAGREDLGAFLRSEADYAQSQYELSSQQRNLKTVQIALLAEMGEDGYEAFSVTGTFSLTAGEEKFSEEKWKENPEYITAQYRVEAARYRLDTQAGDFYPDVSLSGGVSRSGDRLLSGERSWNMGISLSYPFFSGGKDILDLKIAALDDEIARDNLTRSGQALALEYQRTYNDYIDSLEFLQVREKYHRAVRERAGITQEKYINGLVSYQEWDLAENDFISAEKSLLEAQYNLFASWAGWKNFLAEEEE
ncbi:MAG TPA: TolC family protein [bacterium]|nr:TolC family protein [bacterium]